MKVLLLGGSNSRNSGGVFVTARTLGHYLHKNHHVDVNFLMHDDEYSNCDRKYYDPMPLYNYNTLGPKNLGYSFDLYSKLQKIKPDLIHTQTIWMYLSFLNKKYTYKKNIPYLISPHGMLDVWQLKQSYYKKKVVLALYEMQHLQNANCLHALCQSEYVSIRDFGLKTPVAIIPNGVELPDEKNDFALDQAQINWKTNNIKTVLFLSRLHEKKGLDILLQAWSLVNAQANGWQLIIAGESKDTKYLHSLTAITKKLKINNTVQFIGGQYGNNKNACFENADAFILPSYSEGLPIAILEAWSYCLPVLATSFCNLPEGFIRKAAIKINTDIGSISEGLEKIFSLSDEERKKIGQNGFQLVKEKYTWEKVAKDTMALYEWVTGQKEKPDFIYG